MCLFCQLLCLWKIIAKLMYAKGASDGARGASKHGMYAGEVPKNYVTHDKSLASKLLSCDVQKKLPWRRFRSRPDRRGVPLLLLFTELFYGVSLFHYFAAWISKYVRAWCAEYNRASTSKKKASQKKCWNRDMIRWQNHIITLAHSLDLASLNVASYPLSSSRIRSSPFPPYFGPQKVRNWWFHSFKKPILKNRFIQ